MNREEPPNKVPEKDKQQGEDLWQRYGAERGVWSEAMLIALHERRVKGADRRETDSPQGCPEGVSVANQTSGLV